MCIRDRGMNEIMQYDSASQTSEAMPYRGHIPASLLKEMTRMVKVAQRFPRAVLFLGDYQEITLGNYATWQTELRLKFHELGWRHVYDANKLFEAMPRAADGLHFAYTAETDANVQSIICAVVRHASTLLPWEWMDLQKQWAGAVIPTLEVQGLDKLDDEDDEPEVDTPTPDEDEPMAGGDGAESEHSPPPDYLSLIHI